MNDSDRYTHWQNNTRTPTLSSHPSPSRSRSHVHRHVTLHATQALMRVTWELTSRRHLDAAAKHFAPLHRHTVAVRC